MSLGLLDIDTVRFQFDGQLDDAARRRFDHGKWAQTTRDEPGNEWTGKILPDLVVREYLTRGQVVVSGSPHKVALGESVGPFGPAEFAGWVNRFAVRLGVDPDDVRAARVSRFDVAANLDVAAPAAEYVAIAEPPMRMRAVGSGATTVTFRNTRAQVTLYDKVQKILDRKRAHALPPSWEGKNVLRVEARFLKPRREFGRDVTVGMLCDPAFWAEVADRYEERALAVALRRGSRAVPAPESVPELVDAYAAIGIQASGGTDVAIARINGAVRRKDIQRHQGNRQRKKIRELASHQAGDADLADEFASRVAEAAASVR